MLAASTWELAEGLIAHPESLVIRPVTAAVIVLLGSILSAVGQDLKDHFQVHP